MKLIGPILTSFCSELSMYMYWLKLELWAPDSTVWMVGNTSVLADLTAVKFTGCCHVSFIPTISLKCSVYSIKSL